MSENVIFMIDGGKALEMVKEHIAERALVWREVREMAKELGASNVYTDRTTGALSGVVFQGAIHPDFSKPKKSGGVSYPKAKTEWKRRLDAHNGYKDTSKWISEEFSIPLSLSYKTKNGGWGNTCIGNFLCECGFLYLSEQGPYAMWVPDVPYYVSQYAKNGNTVDEPAASFKLEFDGCRRLEKEEWEILVLQHDLTKKRAA